MMKPTTIAASLMFAAFAPGALAAPIRTLQPPGAAPARFAATTLDISAAGEVSLAPDMASISLGVASQAPSAAEAMARNAAAMARVVAALGARGVAGRAIQTSNLDLSPRYVYAQNQPPRLVGYQASNQVTITVLDLARLGRTVDAAVAAGANNVNSISFGLRSRVPAENAARLAAVKRLDDEAALYADAAGYRIRRLVNLTEGPSYPVAPPRPMMLMGAARAAAPTPVEAGEIKVRVEVSGEFELER
ncbi:MAG TPA: SIMPL domain-containing protein [Caulobacteraceae bacterium]|nr:SIMPL domain-containing protein [Caulobacteraceae bacterium]